MDIAATRLSCSSVQIAVGTSINIDNDKRTLKLAHCNVLFTHESKCYNDFHSTIRLHK